VKCRLKGSNGITENPVRFHASKVTQGVRTSDFGGRKRERNGRSLSKKEATAYFASRRDEA